MLKAARKLCVKVEFVRKKALITGITGQDGSYLTEFLLDKSYEVHGIVRRVAFEDPEHRTWRINHLLDRVVLHSASLESYSSIFKVVEEVQPDECYHLAAQSFVTDSFDDEFSTMNTNVNGTHSILSCVKERAPHCRFYFAGSSEMFGQCHQSPQAETTPFNPRSAYGISKLSGFHLTRNYRESYDLFACNGILFNHESPRRGHEFVTRKISYGVASIKHGVKSELKLGNLQAKRDWGYAVDYVKAMWLMLQLDRPGDYVIATGETHSVQEFVELAFGNADLDWRDHVKTDERFYRPTEIHELMGDAAKAQQDLNWQPTATFEELVEMMVKSDIESL